MTKQRASQGREGPWLHGGMWDAPTHASSLEEEHVSAILPAYFAFSVEVKHIPSPGNKLIFVDPDRRGRIFLPIRENKGGNTQHSPNEPVGADQWQKQQMRCSRWTTQKRAYSGQPWCSNARPLFSSLRHRKAAVRPCVFSSNCIGA